MKFEIFDNRELDLAGKGYKWADATRQIDREVLDDIRRTRGENYADGLSDDFRRLLADLCRRRWRALFCSFFDFSGDAPRPVYWSKGFEGGDGCGSRKKFFGW